MARIGDTCVSIGNEDWYIGDAESYDPTANISRDIVRAIVGGVTDIDGSMSFTDDPDGDVLYYEWSVTLPPSLVEAGVVAPTFGIDDVEIQIDTDELGLYQVELRVVGANGGCGTTDSALVISTGSQGPQYDATSLDTSWLWQLLPSMWGKVDRDNRLKIELFWRALLQTIGSDLTRLYAFDRNKAVQAMSELRPARWVPIHLDVPLSDATLVALPREDATITEGRLSGVSLPVPIYARATVRSPRQLTPTGASYTPRVTDRGRLLTITLPDGTTLSSRVADVQVTQEGDVVYLLPSSAASRLSAFRQQSVTFTLTPSAVEVTRAVVQGVHSSIIGSRGSIAGHDLEGDVEVYPYLRVKDAFGLGVRRGDLLTVRVHDMDSTSAIDVDLEVKGVVAEQGGVDYVLFGPRGQTFTDLLKDACDALFPQRPDTFDELKAALNKGYWVQNTGLFTQSTLEVFHETDRYTYHIQIDLMHVRRRRACRVEGAIYRLTVLREFIELHATDTSNTIVLPESMRARYLGRPPVTLFENDAFEVYADGVTLEGVDYNVGDDFVSYIVRDVDELVGPGDTLLIRAGFGRGRYKVTRAYGSKIFLASRPRFSFNNAQVIVEPRVEGSLVTFTEDALLALNCPSVLWAESATIRDIDELEANLGVISGLTFAQYQELAAQAGYGDVLRAIHYARMRGSSIQVLKTLIASMLGLAYASSRERVVRINPAYRFDESATYDKIFTETISPDGTGLGEYNVYFVRSATSSSLPEMIGTEDAVQLNAILEPGTLIGRGVEIVDAIDSGLPRPQDRHTFDVRIAAGASPLTLTSLEQAVKQLDLCKPAYTDYALTPIMAVSDDVVVESSIGVTLTKSFTDTPYGLHGPAEVLDDYIPGSGFMDTAPYTVLTTWFPRDGNLSYEGSSTLLLKSVTAGLQAPPTSVPFTVKLFDEQGEAYYRTYQHPTNYDQGEWIRPGDAVIFPDLPRQQPLRVHNVVDDTTIALDYTGASLSEGQELSFVVVRFVTDLLLDTALISSGSEEGVQVIELGARASNVSRGDVVSFSGVNDAARPIIGMRGQLAYLAGRPYAPLSQMARQAGTSLRIRRPSLEPRYKSRVTLSAPGDHGAIHTPPHVYRLDDNADYLGVRVGDELNGVQVIAIMPHRAHIALAESLPLGEYVVVQPQGIDGHDALDLASRGVSSAISLTLLYGHVQTTVADRLSIQEGGRMVHADLQRGDLVEITYVNPALQLVFRVLDVTSEGIYTNLPEHSTIPIRATSMRVTRQSPLRPRDGR